MYLLWRRVVCRCAKFVHMIIAVIKKSQKLDIWKILTFFFTSPDFFYLEEIGSEVIGSHHNWFETRQYDPTVIIKVKCGHGGHGRGH